MSDVATLSRLTPAVSQLPVDWYFDEKVFELEKKLIFDAGPGYVGHQLMVPEAGDYRSLEWKDHGQMLLNGGSEGANAGHWQMSNVCRHRQAVMLRRGTDRCAAFSAKSLFESEQGQVGELAWPALQGAALGQC